MHLKAVIDLFRRPLLGFASTGDLCRAGYLPIKTSKDSLPSAVDTYWGEHTVNSRPFRTPTKSIRYLQWRFEQYPLFKELMELYGSHDGQVILDYGCGPGNDLVGYGVYSNAQKLIGIDVSEKALELARRRLLLHKISPERIELIQTSDSNVRIPLCNCTVDHIYCEGVLHHSSNPENILEEFCRVLRPNSRACVMVYNRNSLWFHLYTAYEKMILQNAFPGLDVERAFSKTTDGEWCPISRCYRPEGFIGVCENAGFQAEFVGGYFSLLELNLLEKLGERAVRDERLGEEHRAFLRSLVYDEKGYPTYEGKHAGIGGVYRLYKVIASSDQANKKIVETENQTDI